MYKIVLDTYYLLSSKTRISMGPTSRAPISYEVKKNLKADLQKEASSSGAQKVAPFGGKYQTRDEMIPSS